MSNILVIGGAGYLGSILCRKLLHNGYKVRVIDSLMYGDNGIKDLYNNKNFSFIKGDIRNIQSVVEAVDDMDAVINLAAIVGDPASELNPNDTLQINYLAAKIIASICEYKKIARFIHASTASVYGRSEDEGILTEESKLNPLSLYAKMKLKSEQGILDLKNGEFCPIILRKGTLYGLSPRMRFDLVANLFVMNAYSKKELTIFGGDQKRCFCSVGDAAESYIKCLEAPIEDVHGKIFNVSSENLEIKYLGKIIADEIGGVKLNINKKNIDNRSYVTSSKRLKDCTDWKPKDNIIDFIKEVDPKEWEDYKNPIYNNYEFLKAKK